MTSTFIAHWAYSSTEQKTICFFFHKHNLAIRVDYVPCNNQRVKSKWISEMDSGVNWKHKEIMENKLESVVIMVCR